MIQLELQELINKGHSLSQIAQITNKTRQVIKYWFRKYNLKSKFREKQNTTPVSKDQLEELVNQHISSYEIAKKLNKSQTSIRHWLKKYSLKTHALSKCPRPKGIKPRFRTDAPDFYCPECKTQKTQIDFYKSVRNRCIPCTSIYHKVRRGRIVDGVVQPFKKMSEDTKKKISEARKKYLKEHPDSFFWRKKDKFKSVPCEKMKEFLKSKNIQFIAEYEPKVEGRYFSCDIAMPDKMLIIEVNGTQHYEKDGQLKPYYQTRHELIEALGWTVIEMHYTTCYKLEKLEQFFGQLNNFEKKADFDYLTYVPPVKVKKLKISEIEPNWRHRLKPHTYKVPHPTKEELEKLIWEMPVSHIAKRLGVSDNSIRKWCKNYNIPPLSRYYWSGKIRAVNNTKNGTSELT